MSEYVKIMLADHDVQAVENDLDESDDEQLRRTDLAENGAECDHDGGRRKIGQDQTKEKLDKHKRARPVHSKVLDYLCISTSNSSNPCGTSAKKPLASVAHCMTNAPRRKLTPTLLKL